MKWPQRAALNVRKQIVRRGLNNDDAKINCHSLRREAVAMWNNLKSIDEFVIYTPLKLPNSKPKTS